jgi:hypothetical protein
MNWTYWYNRIDGYFGAPATCYRRSAGAVYQQFKSATGPWGMSEAEFIVGSHVIPDTAFVLSFGFARLEPSRPEP